MYCKRCTSKLTPVSTSEDFSGEPWLGGKPGEIPYQSPRRLSFKCPVCQKQYDPNDPRTYRTTLALSWREIAVKIVVTTAIGFLVANIVSFHQLSQASGH